MSGLPLTPTTQNLTLATPIQQDQASKTKETAEKFEAVFLTQFVDQMLKTVGPTAFGGEKQAEIWRSFMSESIADTLVDHGGFGVGHNVAEVIGAYDAGRKHGD